MRKWIVGLLALGAVAGGTMPAFGGSAAGSVSAQVTVASPCLTVGTPSLDFGSLGFSSTAAPVGSGPLNVTITNCNSAVAEDIVARGTDATGGGARWTLTQPIACPAVDQYEEDLLQLDQTGRVSQRFDLVSTADTPIATGVAGGAGPRLQARITMPCTGSSGGGQVMTFSYNFTATL